MSTPAPRDGARLRITGGGAPTGEQWAALAAAAQALAQGAGGPPADPRPEAYRSRWRRAAMLETTEVPAGIKDNGPTWGGTA